MKNAIVYSINTVGEKFENSIRFRQLCYSVSRLRRFNKDINVYVYVSDKDFFYNIEKYKSLNVVFKYFDIPVYNISNIHYSKSNNAEKLWHRWANTFEVLKSLEYDNVLYIDTDTIFYNDPEILFSIYGNTNSIYTKEDNCYEIMNSLGVDKNGLNAGQVLFSKSLLFSESGMFEFMDNYIDLKLKEIRTTMSREMYHQTIWVIDQYALYEYYKSIDISVKIYDKKHVMLHLEPWINETSELVLHHYLNRNYKVAVPAEFVYDNILERILQK
jgi:hypothetical protein